jgi:site-specific DNA-methyltransferase (adenine-specific)
MLDGARIAKSRYHWEQPGGPAQQLIEWLCPQGGVVLDPFAGTGTYGAATLATGRQFVGVELDRRRFEQSCERLRDVGP